MAFDLEDSEKLFLSVNDSHKRYVKYLNDYILALMETNRFIEAKYYFELLFLRKPNSKEANVLGYKIAIRMFDFPAIQKHNEFLWYSGFEKQELLCLRLEFYYAINNRDFNPLAIALLEQYTLKLSVLQTLIELVMDREPIEAMKIIPYIYKYLLKHKLKPSDEFNVIAKKMMIQNLVDTLSVVKI
ncbi:hypothetical protein ACLH09_23280 [Citrobacter braakii]|uniref:hypothetical protein n=1 Tax=Citrobacter braakii TaxID=57706 RepID=UPI0037715089|nr:hypothetical protein [Citrobacter braakii]